MPRDNGLTDDVPYEPDLDAEDRAEVMSSTNKPSFARDQINQRARAVEDVEVERLNKSLIKYQERLDELMAQIDKREEGGLTEDEAAYVVERGLMQVVRDAKRMSHRLKAMEQLTRLREKKLIIETRVEATAGQLTDGKPPKPRLHLPGN
jgi:predicted transcriptional regulator